MTGMSDRVLLGLDCRKIVPMDFATTLATDDFIADSQENGEIAAATVTGTTGKMREGYTDNRVRCRRLAGGTATVTSRKIPSEHFSLQRANPPSSAGVVMLCLYPKEV